MKIAILGGGAAGTAAAWAARRAGADVTLWLDRSGATSLYAGALDLKPWTWESPGHRDPGNGHAEPVDSDVLAFATAFEAWSLGPASALVATHEGVLRPARGIDTALLDLAPLRGQLVAIAAPALPSAPRGVSPIEGWDARALARSLDARGPMAGGIRFEAVRVDGIFDEREMRYSAFDRAALHDSKERTERLAECLSRARPGAAAWLVGPWLGTLPGCAERLCALIEKPCGETTSSPGGPAGARFDAARDALLSNLGVSVRRARVEALEHRPESPGSPWWPVEAALDRVTAPSMPGGVAARAADVPEPPLGFDAVVLATGGLVGGGIELVEQLAAEAAAGPEGAGDAAAALEAITGFRSSVRGPMSMGLGRRVFDRVSSLHGIDLVAQGTAALERVGIVTDGSVVPGVPALFAAGDCVAGRPRTALSAVRAGISAARRAMKV